MRYYKNQNRGVSLVSYGLIVGLISVVALTAITNIGDSTVELFENVSTSMSDARTGTTSAGPSTPMPTPPDTFTSCAEILQFNPGAPSSVYEIDTDGSGPDAPFDAQCDMTTAGGGWTKVMILPGTQSYGNNANLWNTSENENLVSGAGQRANIALDRMSTGTGEGQEIMWAVNGQARRIYTDMPLDDIFGTAVISGLMPGFTARHRTISGTYVSQTMANWRKGGWSYGFYDTTVTNQPLGYERCGWLFGLGVGRIYGLASDESCSNGFANSNNNLIELFIRPQ